MIRCSYDLFLFCTHRKNKKRKIILKKIPRNTFLLGATLNYDTINFAPKYFSYIYIYTYINDRCFF